MNKTEAKKIVSIVLNVLVWVILVFATLVTILTFVSMNAKDGVPSIFGKSIVSVQSPSMDGNKEGYFKQGDMLFVDKVTQDEAWDLDEGTIIVYRAPIDINGDGETGDINTHRIVRKWTTEGGIVYFKTQGDAEAEDTYDLRFTDVVAVYNGHSRLRGMGAVADFLKSSVGFLLVVVLPMALFFLYELYNLLKIIMEQKMQKAAATASATVSAETEEEIKRRAIEEFLAQQAAENAEKPADSDEE
jgi:signal peptidase